MDWSFILLTLIAAVLIGYILGKGQHPSAPTRTQLDGERASSEEEETSGREGANRRSHVAWRGMYTMRR
jgi:uncharacterized membrane-anchored protein YhcB (DUF1043 family)